MVVPIQQRKRVPVAPCDNQKDIISYLNLEILIVVLVYILQMTNEIDLFVIFVLVIDIFFNEVPVQFFLFKNFPLNVSFFILLI